MLINLFPMLHYLTVETSSVHQVRHRHPRDAAWWEDCHKEGRGSCQTEGRGGTKQGMWLETGT